MRSTTCQSHRPVASFDFEAVWRRIVGKARARRGLRAVGIDPDATRGAISDGRLKAIEARLTRLEGQRIVSQ